MHIAKPIYGLLKKEPCEWGEHKEAARRLKRMLTEAPTLRKAVYGKESPIFFTVDTSPTGIGWVINQKDEGGTGAE